MKTSSYGFWILPSGKGIEIHDHAEFAQEHPEKLGLSARAIRRVHRLPAGLDREEIIRIVCKDCGAIRLRAYSDGLIEAQFYGNQRRNLKTIRHFLNAVSLAGEQSYLYCKNEKTGAVVQISRF